MRFLIHQRPSGLTSGRAEEFEAHGSGVETAGDLLDRIASERGLPRQLLRLHTAHSGGSVAGKPLSEKEALSRLQDVTAER